MADVQNHRQGRRGHSKLRIYPCRYCGGFHLTKQQPRAPAQMS